YNDADGPAIGRGAPAPPPSLGGAGGGRAADPQGPGLDARGDIQHDPERGRVRGALVSRLWDASNEFEWEKALGDELLLDRKYPYLLCNTFRKASGRRISGFERSKMLREEIESHFGEEHGESDRRYYLRTLYNEEDYYCAYGQLPATGEFRRPVRTFWVIDARMFPRSESLVEAIDERAEPAQRASEL
ncbi:hypothetical protein THAOC_30108, partial [Thalassiosira oceanica]